MRPLRRENQPASSRHGQQRTGMVSSYQAWPEEAVMARKRLQDPFSGLERLFHEPKRLAILSNLAGVAAGLTFSELRKACDLTDGNLNRHLKMLEDARAVRVRKEFIGAKPRTTVFLSREGRRGFLRYLDALEAALKTASASLRSSSRERRVKIDRARAK